MRRLLLGGTGIADHELGFGCADLFREPSSRGRRRLLDAAFDAGIRHFDVAPMYGLGLVEGELARFARGRRDRVVIATKFGIAPDACRASSRGRPGTGPTAPRRVPGLRERAPAAARRPEVGQDRQAPLPSARYDAGAGSERASSEACRRCAPTIVDILFLHDPLPRERIGRRVGGSSSRHGRRRTDPRLGRRRRAGSTLAAAARLGPDVPVLQLRRGLLDPGRETRRRSRAGRRSASA